MGRFESGIRRRSKIIVPYAEFLLTLGGVHGRQEVRDAARRTFYRSFFVDWAVTQGFFGLLLRILYALERSNLVVAAFGHVESCSASGRGCARSNSPGTSEIVNHVMRPRFAVCGRPPAKENYLVGK
jgi:hypothetical protein